MDGGSTPQDLETMFQLLHLRFTQPRADPDGVCGADLAGQGAAGQSDGEPGRGLRPDDRRGAEPEQSAAAAGDAGHRGPVGPATKSLAFYKARFADASHFTFVFVGSFTPEMMKPFVETYVASLPATRAKKPGATSASRRRPASSRRRSRRGIAPKSQVAIVFSGPFEYDAAAPCWRCGR